MDICQLCEKGKPTIHSRPTAPWDVILLDSPNFHVFPTIGSIVEGWLLIAPKSHYLCMGALKTRQFAELRSLTIRVTSLMKVCFGPVVVFEHGPTKENLSVGCGVDHAHLHVVSTSSDLYEGVKRKLGAGFEWTPIEGFEATREAYDAGLSYLFLQTRSGKSFIATHYRFPSQIFRQVIAEQAGKPGRFDWKSFYEVRNIKLTIAKINAFLPKSIELPEVIQGNFK